MAAKRDDTGVIELDRPADPILGPRLIIAAGRGRVGKSVLLRLLIENHGGKPVIADADRTNPTLLAFFPGAIRPPSAEDDDVRRWLNACIDAQIEQKTTMFLDLGGGDQTLRQWSRELDLAAFLDGYGITPVLLHLLGSDLDDLTYLRDLETVFAPAHTALVLNEGMVPPGRSPAAAFGPVIDDPVFLAAVARGAVTVPMRALGCMKEIDRLRIGFREAAEGRALPPTMRQQVVLWRRAMVDALAPIAAWVE